MINGAMTRLSYFGGVGIIVSDKYLSFLCLPGYLMLLVSHLNTRTAQCKLLAQWQVGVE